MERQRGPSSRIVTPLGPAQPGTTPDPDEVDSAKEVAELGRRAAAAALDDVRNPAQGQDSEYDVPGTVRGTVTSLYEGYLAAQDALGEARTADDEGGDYSRDLELLLRRASEIERDVVVQARRRGEVSPEEVGDIAACGCVVMAW